MAYSIALVFILGKVPGCASVMGLICVLGSVLNAALSPQNNLLFVSSWVCTSNPITTWYLSFCFTAAKVRSRGQLAMSSLQGPVHESGVPLSQKAKYNFFLLAKKRPENFRTPLTAYSWLIN